MTFTKKINWQTKKLGEVCDFQRGLTYSKKDEVDFSESVVLRSNNIGLVSSSLNLGELRYINNKILIPDNKKVKKGSIIICTANGSKSHLGKIALIDKDYGYAFGGFMGQLRPKNEIDSKYFFYILTSDSYKKHLAKISSGANINNLKFSDLSEFQIPLPPLPEQRRIVKILDEVFEKMAKAKENAEKNLQNAGKLFESYLRSIFTNQAYEIKTIEELCKDVEYGSSLKSKTTGKVPVLRMGNIQEGRFTWDKLVYSNDSDEIKKYLLKYNDVLFNRTNSPELVGKTAIYKGEMPAIFAGYLIRIHRKENLLDADYLNYFLNSDIAKDYGKTVVISSVNQANINGTKLKGYPIPTPSLHKQKRIVARLDALSAKTKRLEVIYKQKLANLEELKKSVLKKAFAGEL